MKRNSVLDHQSVKRARSRPSVLAKKVVCQLGFGLVKTFIFVLGLGVLSLGLISGYQFVSSSPFFRIQDVVIAGVGGTLEREIIKLSGIQERESFFSVDSFAIKRNIERHPWIKSAHIDKKFPNTLYINAEKNDPMAMLFLGTWHLIDREGVIFKEVAQGDCVDLPVVTGLSPDDQENGRHLKRVAAFLNALSAGDTLLPEKDLSEIHVEKDGALTMYLSKFPFKVFLGSDGFSAKIDSLVQIMRHLTSTHRLHQARSIDLDYGDRVIVAFNESVL